MTSQTNRHPVLGSLTVAYGLILCLHWFLPALYVAVVVLWGGISSKGFPVLEGVVILAVLLAFLSVSVMLVISGRGLCRATPAFDPLLRFRIVVTMTLLVLKAAGFGLLALLYLSVPAGYHRSGPQTAGMAVLAIVVVPSLIFAIMLGLTLRKTKPIEV